MFISNRNYVNSKGFSIIDDNSRYPKGPMNGGSRVILFNQLFYRASPRNLYDVTDVRR